MATALNASPTLRPLLQTARVDRIAVFEAMDFKGDLETYTSGFEESFLASTKEFYAKRAQEWIGTDDSPTFLKKAEQALKEEMARVKKYLIGSTESKVCDVVVQEVLQKYKDPLLNKEGSGCLALLKDDRRDYKVRRAGSEYAHAGFSLESCEGDGYS